jgi:sulfoacetaldehyde acetyltransferase
LSKARFPVILSGAGVVLSGAIPDLVKLAERLDAPVCSNYQHNDSFPGSHRSCCRSARLQWLQGRHGTDRQGRCRAGARHPSQPVLTLPGYGIDYWPKNAEVIQVDINADRIGLTKKVTVGIEGDATKVARAILAQLSDDAGDAGREDRRNLVSLTKSRWAQELSSLDHEDDDPGTFWNEESRKRDADLMSPRQAWRAIQSALPRRRSFRPTSATTVPSAMPIRPLNRAANICARPVRSLRLRLPSILGAKIGQPDVPVVGFAGDGAFGISMNEMTACGRDDWPAITMVIFRNYQWGAEKRNTTLWYDNNFVGTELDRDTSYAKIAEACGAKGVMVRDQQSLTEELSKAIERQMKNGETTFIEVLLNQELGEPFRRDAMKKPVVVAGINRDDMRPQQGAV